MSYPIYNYNQEAIGDYYNYYSLLQLQQSLHYHGHACMYSPSIFSHCTVLYKTQ